MTDLASPPSPPSVRPTSPAAARLRPARWRDVRLVGGILLVLISVVVGARVVANADVTTPVVVARSALAAGKVLTADDLTTTRVHLSTQSAGNYVTGDRLTSLVGLELSRSVAQGDLMPIAAVAPPGQTGGPFRVVSVIVKPGRLPRLSAGDQIDVFATYKVTDRRVKAGQDGDVFETVPLLRGVTFLRQDGAGGDGVAVQLQVAPADIATLVYASENAAIDLALQGSADDQAGDVGSGQVTAPPAVRTVTP